MTPTTKAGRALLADLAARWPERGRKRMRDTVAFALPAIESAARAEAAAEAEALRAALEPLNLARIIRSVDPRHDLGAAALADAIYAALATPAPAALDLRCPHCGNYPDTPQHEFGCTYAPAAPAEPER